MKATVEIDDALYRRLEAEATRRGRTVHDLVVDGVERVLAAPAPPPASGAALPSWFASLRGYAANAGGTHELTAVRESIAARRDGPG